MRVFDQIESTIITLSLLNDFVIIPIVFRSYDVYGSGRTRIIVYD